MATYSLSRASWIHGCSAAGDSVSGTFWRLCTEHVAAATPASNASTGSLPLDSLETAPPTKQSPAPTRLATLTGSAGTWAKRIAPPRSKVQSMAPWPPRDRKIPLHPALRTRAMSGSTDWTVATSGAGQTSGAEASVGSVPVRGAARSRISCARAHSSSVLGLR